MNFTFNNSSVYGFCIRFDPVGIHLRLFFQENGSFVGKVDSVYLGEGSPDILIVHAEDNSTERYGIPQTAT